MIRQRLELPEGDTADLAYLVEQLRAAEPDAPITGIGYCLGGDVRLKWLGETGETSPLTAAAADAPHRQWPRSLRDQTRRHLC